MKHAYIHKNLRELNFESQVILGCHFLTLLACFMPWFAATPAYEQVFWYNSFKGPGFMIGTVIFIISLLVVVTFLDRILERNVIKLPFSRNYVYLFAGVQQIFLIVLMWSVLMATGSNYADHSLRFGIFMAFAVQVCGLVATFLNFQLEKQKQAQSFFQHPETPKPEAPHDKQ
jgi:hypothetical protein